MDLFHSNLKALETYQPEVYQSIKQYQQVDNKRLELIEAKNGDKTLRVTFEENGIQRKVFLHSKFNPQEEGQKFAEEVLKQQNKINLLYGFAMGYHVEAICQSLTDENKMYIFDTNIDVFIEAIESRDLTKIFVKPNIKLYITQDVSLIAKEMSRLISKTKDINIFTHVPSINTMDEDTKDLKDLMLEINLRKSVSDDYLEMMQDNYLINRKNIDKNVGVFFGKFTKMPIIIVCAGPSLDKNKDLLFNLKDKAVIMCVGKALKSLISINVKPHFLITIDPGETTYQQIKGLENLNIPFILLATANSLNGNNYKGPKYMACQYEEYLQLGEETYLVKTGGSVSTTALDIAIKMGGNPIIYIGQDLAYSNDRHHCYGTIHEEVEVKTLKNMRSVKGWNGEDIPTTLGMLSFKRWIENRVSKENNRVFINATEGGAFINGFVHMSLKDVKENYLNEVLDINNTIKRIIN